MKKYIKLGNKINNYGIDYKNARTGKVCRTLTGTSLQFNLSKGFPAVTTKKLAFKSVVGELLGFFRGYTNAKDFRALGCNIWDKDANESSTWLSNPFRQGEDDLGEIYGKQWTAWESTHFINKHDMTSEKNLFLIKNNYRHVGTFVDNHLNDYHVYKKEINQLEEALEKIITDPSDRRIIVNGWNPGALVTSSLPACHCMYVFTPLHGTLDCTMFMRSNDYPLGAPFNIASTALFLSIMARLSGLQPGKVTIQCANSHIYEDQSIPFIRQIAEPPYSLPHLFLSDNIKKVESIEDIKGVFTRIEPSDISLIDYRSHPPVKMNMSTSV